jgi:hypothetical protein
LVTLYWPALRAHLVIRRRLALEVADDFLQGFAADRILQQEFLGHVMPQKGRFRSFLLRCLENYVVDRLFRTPERGGTNADDRLAEIPVSETNQSDPFDVAWARQVLTQALQRMQADCTAQGRPQIWLVFEERVLRPALGDAQPPSYEQLIDRLGFDSPEKAANALATAKRHFRRVLETVVAEYVEDEAELQEEIANLRSILAVAGAMEAVAPQVLPPSLAGEGPILPDPPVGMGPVVSRKKVAQDDRSSDVTANDSNLLSLSRLFQIDGCRDSAWNLDDMPGLLQHLLHLPLADAMAGLDPTAICGAQAHGAVLPSTLAELFAHPDPPLALLESVKVWSRRATRDDQAILPIDVVSLLYFASIAAAKVRLGQWISKLDPSLFRQGIEMLRSEPWVGEPFQSLFQAVGCDPSDVDSSVDRAAK